MIITLSTGYEIHTEEQKWEDQLYRALIGELLLAADETRYD